jgi:hypothetical protein
VIIEGKVEAADGSDVTVIVNEVRRVEEQIARASRSVSIALPAVGIDEQFLDDMLRDAFGVAREGPMSLSRCKRTA